MLSVADLTFTYPAAAAPTLRGLGFSVDAGEVYGLLGPSGAGKSTTQRILMGLLDNYGGEARVFGEPLRTIGRGYYERIGVSFELPAVYLRLTARENLRLFAALYERPSRDPLDALRQVDLAEEADQRVETFSKGMKMRLNLARALLHDPDLLFLDEPTTGQDPARARTTRDLIRRLGREGKSVFMTTHNMAEAEEVCDRVGFLVGGMIPVTGTPAELKRRYGRPTVEVSATASGRIETERFPLEGLATNAAFQTRLAAGNIVAIHSLEASLDDVFIAAASGKIADDA